MTAFERFVLPARTRPQLWRLVVGLILAIVIYTLWVIAVLAAAWFTIGEGRNPTVWASGIAEADEPVGTLILLLTFVGMALGPMLVARWIHKRPAGSLFGPRVRTLRDFAIAAGIVFAVLGVSLGLWSFQYDAVPNLPVSLWLLLLPLTLLGLVVQTGAEEVLFRGYLQSQLAARFRSPIAWLVIPSLLFGIVHFDPTRAGDNAWLVVASAATFGLLAADLTARTGSIGAAWGFHFANNTVAIAILSTDGTISGLSRWLTPYTLAELDGPGLIVALDVAMLILAWWLVRRAVAR
jgi:uncharacterized protein